VREETHHKPDVCVFCKRPITQQQWPYKRLESGEKAHLACFLDDVERREKEPGS